jgi:uncharacterized protein YjbI with pentapeptide repeats
MRRLLLAILTGLLILTTIGGATSYVLARDAPYLPGHPLFAMQVWSEQIWSLTLNSDKSYRARILLTVFKRRIDDLEAVRGTAAELEALTHLEATLEKVLSAIGEASRSDQPPLWSQLVSQIERALELLATLDLMQAETAKDSVLALSVRLDSLLEGINESGDGSAVTINAARSATRPNIVTLTAAELLDNSLGESRVVPFPNGAIDHSFFPLVGGHELECTVCHIEGDYEGTSYRCSTCHASDEVHGGVYGNDCARCHSVIAWQAVDFDHSVIVSTDCAKCHTPPANHFEGACQACHTDTGNFRNAFFDHSFIGGADCAACHAPPANHYSGICRACHADTGSFRNASFDHSVIGGTDCVACHAPPANHYAGTCRACHTDTGNFRNASFDHSVIGGTDCVACHAPPANHYAGTCRACHTDTGNFRNASFDHSVIGGTDCVACHAPPANHYAGSCRACHTDTGNFRNATFDHSVIGGTDCSACHNPPGNHYPGECRSCHVDTGNFHNVNFSHAGLTDCQGCHARPAGHYAGQCSDCHSTSSFSGASFSHTFPVDHKGANGQCASCHPGGDTSRYTCDSCHRQDKMDDKHKEISSYTANCIACHANGKKPGED